MENQNNQLTPYNPLAGLDIVTTDGQTISLSDPASLADYLPGGGGSKPLFRIKVGQDVDEAPDLYKKLFLTRRVRAEAGSGEDWTNEIVGPLPENLLVWPLGFTMNRSYLSKYDPNSNENPVLCHSENFMTPDVKFGTFVPNPNHGLPGVTVPEKVFKGTYSNQCCAVDPKSGKLVAVCPLARWGAKIGDKAQPPACQEQYVIFAAISIETVDGPQLEVIEMYFKSISATSGKGLVQGLRQITQRGYAIYKHPIELSVITAGKGKSFVGAIRYDVKQVHTPEDVGGLEMAIQRVNDALKFRAERAQRLPEEMSPADQAVQAAQAAMADRDYPSPNYDTAPVVTPAAPVNGSNGKSKAKVGLI